MKTLRKGEMCPLHHSFYCCGRTQLVQKRGRKPPTHILGVKRVEDHFHLRGYRELCSKAELRRRKHILMSRDPLLCLYCGGDLRKSEYADIDLCHIEPKGMGGARHDDHMDNLALGHHSCNLENGSKRLPRKDAA